MATLVMGIFFAILFYVFIPGKFFTFPTGSDEQMQQMTHSALFAATLVLSYEVVANYIYKAI